MSCVACTTRQETEKEGKKIFYKEVETCLYGISFIVFYPCTFFPPYKTNQLISLSFQTGLVRCPANNSISIKMINSMIAYRHSLSVLEHFPRSYGKHVNKLLCYFRNNLYIIHFLNNGTEKLHLCSTFLWK